MSLIATPKSASANSYASVAEADNYLLLRRGVQTASWATATTAQKEACLIWATALLDAIYKWNGAPTTYSQALLWPRSGVQRKRDLDWLDQDTIPEILKDATAELAFNLLQADRTAEPALLGLGFSSVTVGPISVTADRAMIKPVIPPFVIAMLGALGEASFEPQGARTIKLVRS